MSMLLLAMVLTLQQVPDLTNVLEKSPNVVVSGCEFANFVQGGIYVAGDTKLTWRRHERANTTSAWQHSTNTYATRYAIIDVGTRNGGDEMYVAGVLPTGESVIERWAFPVRNGGWVHTANGTAPAIGQPAGAYSGTTSISGGTYRNLPATWLAPTITVVWESSALGEIRSIEVDPEGRYLVFTTMQSSSLYQMDPRQSGATPFLLFDASSRPELATAPWLAIGQHKDFGRVLVCLPANLASATKLTPSPSILLLKDANNDGVFDGHTTIAIHDYIESTIVPSVATNPPTPPTWTATWAWGT